MGFQHRLRLFLFSIRRRPNRGGSLEGSAFRGTGTITTDIEYLIQAQPGEELLAAVSTVDDVKMSMPQLLQSKRHAGHRSHKCGIHHGATRQVHHKFAIAAVQHLARELLEIAAVEETTFPLHFHPHGWAAHPYLNR
jgi:hypothetical protein